MYTRTCTISNRFIGRTAIFFLNMDGLASVPGVRVISTVSVAKGGWGHQLIN